MTCPVCGATPPEAAEACPACGADLLALPPGSLLAGRYEVRALLGRGGMGAVYRAWDRVLQEEVALKVQRARAALDPDGGRRFRNEVKLARQITHPSVCRLHDGGEDAERRWISMELVEGETLAVRLRGGPLAADLAWDLALQAAEGLGAVHRAGVVHRDLKPLNFMLDRGGRLRLMDFGIARHASTAATAPTAYALGSPEYMSPEQARGRPADARSDVYALGIVLFEMFAGEVPFRADTPVATLLQHLEAAPRLERVPEPLRPVLERALAKDPQARYADGAALAEALRSTREGSEAEGTPRSTRKVGWRARPALVAAASGLVLVVVLLALGALGWRGRRPLAGPSPAPAAVAATTAPAGTPSSPAGTPSTVVSAAGQPRPGATVAARVTPSPPSDAPTPEPRGAPNESAAVEPTPSPTPPAAPAAAGSPPTAAQTVAPALARPPDGALLVLVRPWANVTVDGVEWGATPVHAIRLAPGRHDLLLTHPDYRDYRRKVTIAPDETLRLSVDLAMDGVRRTP